MQGKNSINLNSGSRTERELQIETLKQEIKAAVMEKCELDYRKTNNRKLMAVLWHVRTIKFRPKKKINLFLEPKILSA